MQGYESLFECFQWLIENNRAANLRDCWLDLIEYEKKRLFCESKSSEAKSVLINAEKLCDKVEQKDIEERQKALSDLECFSREKHTCLMPAIHSWTEFLRQENKNVPEYHY